MKTQSSDVTDLKRKEGKDGQLDLDKRMFSTALNIERSIQYGSFRNVGSAEFSI